LEDAARHDMSPISLAAYTLRPEFLPSVFENWENEFLFLQMSAYVAPDPAQLVSAG